MLFSLLVALRSHAKMSSQKTGEEVGEALEALEKLIERTKVMYEQYFMGIQKMAPQQLHKDVERKIRELTQLQLRNTSLRFRLNTLTQKFGSYNSYWRRTMRKIEQGTYHRHVAKVGRQSLRDGDEVPDEVMAKMPRLMRQRILRERERLAKKEEAEKGRASSVHRIEEDPLLAEASYDLEAAFEKITGEADRAKPPAKTPPRATPPRPPPRPPGATPGTLPPGMTEDQGRRLYSRYVQAREVIGEKSGAMSYDKLMSTLSNQAPKIMARHQARSVDFNVVIKDDKVVVKAKPKK